MAPDHCLCLILPPKSPNHSSGLNQCSKQCDSVAEREASSKVIVGNLSASTECRNARAVVVGFQQTSGLVCVLMAVLFTLTSAGGGSQANAG